MTDLTIERALAELGLFNGATREDIRQSYHKLAALYHPDVNPDPLATEQYLRIRNAYEHLRKYYDRQVLKPQMSAGEPVAYTWEKERQNGANMTEEACGNAGDFRHRAAAVEQGGSRIIGDHAELSAAATRRSFKEEHYKQEKRLKKREESRKKEAEERAAEEKRQKIYDDAMMRIHAYRAGEVMANLVEELLKNDGFRG